MMRRTLLFAVVIFTLASCQKEIDFQLAPSSGNNGGGGNQTPGNYLPATKGSTWKYLTTGTASYESLMTSTGVTKTIDNIVYNAITVNSSGQPPTEVLYARQGRNYYMAEKGLSSGGVPFNMNMLFLNDTAAVGYKWTNNAGTGNGLTARTPGEIIERNMTITVQGKVYKQVIHSKMELEYDIPGMGSMTLAVYDFYTANNIGFIKVVTTGTNLSSNLSTTTELLEYSIK